MATPKTQMDKLDELAGKLNQAKVDRDDAARNLESAQSDLTHAEQVLSGAESRLLAARAAYNEELDL